MGSLSGWRCKNWGGWRVVWGGMTGTGRVGAKVLRRDGLRAAVPFWGQGGGVGVEALG